MPNTNPPLLPRYVVLVRDNLKSRSMQVQVHGFPRYLACMKRAGDYATPPPCYGEGNTIDAAVRSLFERSRLAYEPALVAVEPADEGQPAETDAAPGSRIAFADCWTLTQQALAEIRCGRLDNAENIWFKACCAFHAAIRSPR